MTNKAKNMTKKKLKSIIFVVWTSRHCEDGLHLFNHIND